MVRNLDHLKDSRPVSRLSRRFGDPSQAACAHAAEKYQNDVAAGASGTDFSGIINAIRETS